MRKTFIIEDESSIFEVFENRLENTFYPIEVDEFVKSKVEGKFRISYVDSTKISENKYVHTFQITTHPEYFTRELTITKTNAEDGKINCDVTIGEPEDASQKDCSKFQLTEFERDGKLALHFTCPKFPYNKFTPISTVKYFETEEQRQKEINKLYVWFEYYIYDNISPDEFKLRESKEKKLTRVKFIYHAFPTDREKEKESYLINKEGLIAHVRAGRTKLKVDHEITLEEIKDIYNRVVASVQPKDGERISGLEVDLTEYWEYQEDGNPIFGSEEMPRSCFHEKIAKYDNKWNILNIYENGEHIYRNYDGEEIDVRG